MVGWERESTWPPKQGFMAGDAHDLLSWKLWISKEEFAEHGAKIVEQRCA